MACCDRPTYIKRIEKITKKEASPPSFAARPDESNHTGQQCRFKITAPTIPYHNMTEFVTPAPESSRARPVSPTPNIVPPQGSNNQIGENISDPTRSAEDTPRFLVPQSPLTPEGYNETVDFNQIQYLQGFYQTQIGHLVRVEHIMGTSVVQTDIGFLVGVGVNYLVLQSADSPNITILDMYSIKSVKVFYGTVDFA
ncbi:MAG: hypothetical protein PHX63_01505 [Eubacteriales bacterium]|nr:hypothetical protein [Eubacteriales bacterium]